MPNVIVKALVEGGKASAGPPLGPTLAPLKVNIGQVIAAINEKTKEFAGISVPVSVEINPATKQFTISVGTPPVSQLIKKELKLEKLAKTAWKEPAVGDLKIESAVKIAKLKLDSLGTKNLKKATKEVVATCVSLGVNVEGKNPKEVLKEIETGTFDSKFS
ncbi:MAG TPA: 50S ribosomal protein L11 [archaeon]|nr:50S ribosomal protein L11 [archaeon]